MANIAISGDTSGAITIAAPAVAGTNTLTLPAATGTVMVSGNQPAFSATPTTSQSVTSAVSTKVTLGTENFDTNNNFASSRFTPTVAGYYQFSASLYATVSSGTYVWCLIYKNGAYAITGNINPPVGTSDGAGVASGLLYMNGSTDYAELYAYIAGGSPAVGTVYTNFSGCLVRNA